MSIALNALPLVALATLLGVATTAIIKHRQEQKKFNDVVNEGSEKEVNDLLKKQMKIRDELIKRLEKANGRSKQGIQNRIAEINKDIEALEGRDKILQKEKEITAEQEKRNKQIEEGQKKIKEQEEAAESLKKKFMEIGQAVEEGIVQNLTDAVMGTKTLAEAAISVLNDLKRKLIEVAMQRAVAGIGDFIGNALGGIFGGGGFKTMGGKSLTTSSGTNIGKVGFMPSNPAFRGARARGGSVSSGGSFLVGERGPELFVPARSGTIIPNSNIGGKSVTNNIVVNVDATGSEVQGDDAEATQFGEQLAAAIQAEIINQKRSGGLLN